MTKTAFKRGKGKTIMSGKTDDVIYGWSLTSVSSARLPHHPSLGVTNWAAKINKKKNISIYVHSVAFF